MIFFYFEEVVSCFFIFDILDTSAIAEGRGGGRSTNLCKFQKAPVKIFFMPLSQASSQAAGT